MERFNPGEKVCVGRDCLTEKHYYHPVCMDILHDDYEENKELKEKDSIDPLIRCLTCVIAEKLKQADIDDENERAAEMKKQRKQLIQNYAIEREAPLEDNSFNPRRTLTHLISKEKDFFKAAIF